MTDNNPTNFLVAANLAMFRSDSYAALTEVMRGMIDESMSFDKPQHSRLLMEMAAFVGEKPAHYAIAAEAALQAEFNFEGRPELQNLALAVWDSIYEKMPYGEEKIKALRDAYEFSTKGSSIRLLTEQKWDKLPLSQQTMKERAESFKAMQSILDEEGDALQHPVTLPPVSSQDFDEQLVDKFVKELHAKKATGKGPNR